MKTLSEEDCAIILGALDSLGVALANYDHQWSTGEREIYEQAASLLQEYSHPSKCGYSTQDTAVWFSSCDYEGIRNLLEDASNCLSAKLSVTVIVHPIIDE